MVQKLEDLLAWDSGILLMLDREILDYFNLSLLFNYFN